MNYFKQINFVWLKMIKNQRTNYQNEINYLISENFPFLVFSKNTAHFQNEISPTVVCQHHNSIVNKQQRIKI